MTEEELVVLTKLLLIELEIANTALNIIGTKYVNSAAKKLVDMKYAGNWARYYEDTAKQAQKDIKNVRT